MKRNGTLIFKITLTLLLATLSPGALASYPDSNEPAETPPAKCAQDVSNGNPGESSEVREFRRLLAESDFWRCVIVLECGYVKGDEVIMDQARVNEMLNLPIERRLEFLQNLPRLHEALGLHRLYVNMGLMTKPANSQTPGRRKKSRSETDD